MTFTRKTTTTTSRGSISKVVQMLRGQTYYAAQVLNPYRKWAWFRQEWVLRGDEGRRKWYESAQLAVKQLWETEYKGRYPVEALPPPVRKERDPDPAFDRQREHKRIRIDGPAATTDLYEQYISTDRLHDEEAGCDEAIAYWLSRYDSQRDLARFALDLFAVSPMSDECERLFSSAKLGIVDRRERSYAPTPVIWSYANSRWLIRIRRFSRASRQELAGASWERTFQMPFAATSLGSCGFPRLSGKAQNVMGNLSHAGRGYRDQVLRHKVRTTQLLPGTEASVSWFRKSLLSYQTELEDAGFHKEEISITCFGQLSHVLSDLLQGCRNENLNQIKNKSTLSKRARVWAPGSSGCRRRAPSQRPSSQRTAPGSRLGTACRRGRHSDSNSASSSEKRSSHSEGKGNVIVSVRVRPDANADQTNPDGEWMVDSRKSLIAYRGKEGGDHYYDNVFATHDNNARVYDHIAKRLVRRVMEGYHGTVFAYGMTGTGKTFSMQGTATSPGVIPLAITDIFSYIRETPSREFLLRVSYLEIYNERIHDLLSMATGGSIGGNPQQGRSCGRGGPGSVDAGTRPDRQSW
ncbi:hypothetical protein HIM_10499 [Hirsutella minnesotensis 3608]|uniref:Kinesin motor domain-containing protein n=1 Tax=Hirsutella minnesotensis 3608 TaxID=1043627 RepID=A0A0F7ZG14_9HYPO|nr:hypothetical protein HIM_10499 [Hirsutella minnesotensis 3608]